MADEEIVIDPHFFTPPNVVDLRGPNQEDGSSYYDQTPSDQNWEQPPDEVPNEPAPPVAPTSFELLSQTLRHTEDGKAVVDLILELPDQNGVREYEIRIAKTE